MSAGQSGEDRRSLQQGLSQSGPVTARLLRHVAEVHDRMPVVLRVAVTAAWVDPELQDADQVARIVSEAALEDFVHHPVTARVNSRGAKDDSSLIEPI
jgi:putative SOS response-associated peptidase YedK